MQPVETPRIYSGRYELTHLVARGGMAQVYRAVDRQLDRPVALKVLFPELSVDKTFVERFRREAQAAANLSHPNIVPVFDWGEDDGAYFIVMEYIDGRSLSAVLRDPQRLDPRQVAMIGAGVAAALGFAHRHGVVHRDVKPGNVLITPEGEVKVTDFGIARAVNTEESLTQTGAVMGTAAYFSPEQAEGKGVDARSDIYSLGVVLYEMAVGRPPFSGDSPVAVASKHVRDQPPLPREVNPRVPVALEAVIMKAMAKDPGARYGSAEELRADLLRFAEGRPVEAGDPGLTSVMAAAVGAGAGAAAATGVMSSTGRTAAVPATATPAAADREDEERKKRTRRLVILLIALLVVLGIIAFFLLRSLTGHVTVPNVVGETQAVATQTLHNDNLTVGTVTHHENSAVSGTVLSTNPAAGASVGKNSAVDLVVSSGPNIPTVEVPSVTGLQLAPAIQRLTAANLSYTVKYAESNQPSGIVLSQDPAGGSHIKANVPVALTVVGTQTSVSVPSVLGQSQTNAGAILTRAGLNIGSQTSACSSQFSSGSVASQDPGGGANVPPNTAVNIVISTGTCATVPGVVNQPQSAAQAALTHAGLAPSTTSGGTCATGVPGGTVVSQSPTGGTQVNPGTTVTIAVCQSAPPPTTAPTTTTTTTSTTTTTGGNQAGATGGRISGGGHHPPGG
jgi:serine/threonine-protein kinase